MTTAFRHSVVPQVAAFKANISAGSILVSTLSKGAKTTNGGKVVVDGLVALDKIAACIRGDSKTLPAKTTELRAALQAEGRKGRYETDKLLMPAIMPAAQAPSGTAIKGLSLGHHNGLYGFDVDEQREGMDLAAVRLDLIAAPGAVMVGTSCAGDALFAIFAGPRAETDDEYKRHWTAIAAAMPQSAKANNGKASKNFNRLRFLAHDPDVWLADAVVPLAGTLELTPQLPDSKSGGSPSTLDDRVADADALSWVLPPDDYSAWLGWLPTLKALGFSSDYVEAWSARSTKHKPGEVEQRWSGLPDDNPDDARHKLRGHAHNLGWRKAKPSPVPGDSESASIPARVTQPARIASPDSREQPPSNEWLSFGQWWAERHGRLRWVYSTDPASLGWWAYIGNVWRPLLSTDMRLFDTLARHRYQYAHELATEGKPDLATMLGGTAFTTMAGRGEKGDLWVGLRHACAGDIPEPASHVVGVPSGVVDLRDGTLHNHDPLFGIRALTRGDFTGDVDAHKMALRQRFGKVFDEPVLREYIRLVALALTGMAQSYRPLVMVTGPSGSGKGGACNVVLLALGGRAMGVGQDWIAQRDRSDIDAVGADILERRPAVVVVDEIGGDTGIQLSRVLTLTGNTEQRKRRPHGTLLSGFYAFQLWTTTVSPPELDTSSGLERRLAVLSTQRKLDPGEIDELGGQTPGLLDAVVSLSCLQAREVYDRATYRAPEGSVEAKADALADMDQVAEWLESQDNLDQVPVSEARVKACKALDLPLDALTAAAFGAKVSSSTKWERGRKKNVRFIARRNARLQGVE